MKKSASVASHIHDFDLLFAQIQAQHMTFDDEMKAIFLLCSLSSLWDTFFTMVSNSIRDGKIVYNDVTSQLLSEEMRCKTRDSLQHGKAHYM